MTDPYWNSCNGVICTHIEPVDHTGEYYFLVALILIVIIFFYGGYRLIRKLMTADSSSERYE